MYTKIKEVLKHSAHAPNLFQYVIEDLWWPWKLLKMLLGAEVKLKRKENKFRLLDPFFSELYTQKHIPKVLQEFK